MGNSLTGIKESEPRFSEYEIGPARSDSGGMARIIAEQRSS